MFAISNWLIKKVLPGIIIYMFVSWFAVSLGVEPTTAIVIGAAAAFGEIILPINLRL